MRDYAREYTAGSALTEMLEEEDEDGNDEALDQQGQDDFDEVRGARLISRDRTASTRYEALDQQGQDNFDDVRVILPQRTCSMRFDH